jgi:hypothetical protein
MFEPQWLLIGYYQLFAHSIGNGIDRPHQKLTIIKYNVNAF